MARKREFDPDEALDKAMRFFWQKGYRHSSIRDLIASTGVNFYGLYNVFGDKRGIYLKGLDKYMSRYLARIKRSANQAASLEDALSAIFKAVVEIVTVENDNAGCMVCNAAVEVAPIDQEVAERVKSHRASIEKFCLTLFKEHPQDLSNIAPEQHKAIAEYVCSQIYNIGFLVRSQCTKALINRHIETTITLLK